MASAIQYADMLPYFSVRMESNLGRGGSASEDFDDRYGSGRSTRMPVLPIAESMYDVVSNLDRIIEWSIKSRSAIGYFAIFYKCATLPIRQSITNGTFIDATRMELFGVTFAQRYFDALNGYFHPIFYGEPTLPWRITLGGSSDAKPSMIQHILAGLNVHIRFDLVAATEAIARRDLLNLKADFKKIDSIIAESIPELFLDVKRLSPACRVLRFAIINTILIALRAGAWRSGLNMALRPQTTNTRMRMRGITTAGLSALALWPPIWTPLFLVARFISSIESADVSRNLASLNSVVDSCFNSIDITIK